MKKGFTLVELAMVLIVVGLLMGGAFQMMKVMGEKARSTEAKNTLNAAKEAVIAFAINNNRLPTALEFTNMNLVGAGNIPIYYNSDAALQANVCGTTTTPLNTTDANGINTPNIGFVLAVAGENMLMQTSRVGTRITFPQWNTVTNGRPYDDFHTQATLGELQSTIGCQVPTLANPSLHLGTVGSPYTVTFAGNGGNGTYTFTRTSGSFPAGAPAFSLTPAGLLTGTPTTPGTSIFTIRITSGGMSTTRQYALVVN
jgi:prepilin-type N-terminal cleavage/methylation domain-containing protein